MQSFFIDGKVNEKNISESLNEHLYPNDEIDSSREQLDHHYTLAKIQYDKADLVLAEKHFKLAMEHVIVPRDIFTRFKILGFLIRICHERLDNQCVAEMINQSEQLIEHASSRLGTLNGEYFYNCGMIKSYRGDHLGCKEVLELAIKQSKLENDYELQAKCLHALAKANFQLKNFDSALEYIDTLTQLLAIIDKSYLCGSMYLLSGKIYLELSNYDMAEKYFKMASVHLRGKNCWNLSGHILLNRGKIFKERGEYGTALLYYNLAMDATDRRTFKRLDLMIQAEIDEVTDSNVDIYLDKVNRTVVERTMGTIDFKHRFVLLEILFLLANSVGKYFDKEDLAKLIWKDEYNPLIHDKLIYTSISRLRKLIEPPKGSGSKRKYIVRGKDGYTFCPTTKVRFYLEDSFSAGQSLSDLEIGSPI